MTDLKLFFFIPFWQERSQWNLTETGHSRNPKGVGDVLWECLNIWYLLWKRIKWNCFQNQPALPRGWDSGRRTVPLPSKLAEMSVDSILKDSDLWWWLIKEKLKVSQPRGFYMQKLRSPLKSISLKGKLINPFMIKWLFLILWWNLNAVDGIFKSWYNEVLGSLCSP